LLKVEGLSNKSTNPHKCSAKWTENGINIWLGNNRDNFQLRRFTTSKNITKNFKGLFLLILYVWHVDFSWIRKKQSIL